MKVLYRFLIYVAMLTASSTAMAQSLLASADSAAKEVLAALPGMTFEGGTCFHRCKDSLSLTFVGNPDSLLAKEVLTWTDVGGTNLLIEEGWTSRVFLDANRETPADAVVCLWIKAPREINRITRLCLEQLADGKLKLVGDVTKKRSEFRRAVRLTSTERYQPQPSEPSMAGN